MYWSIFWFNMFLSFHFHSILFHIYIRVLRSIVRINHLRICVGERYGLFKIYVDRTIGTKGVKKLASRPVTYTLWKRYKKTIPFHSISFHFCCMYWPIVWSNMSHFIPFLFHFNPYLYTRAKKSIPNLLRQNVCWRKVRPLQDPRGLYLYYRHEGSQKIRVSYSHLHTLKTK